MRLFLYILLVLDHLACGVSSSAVGSDYAITNLTRHSLTRRDPDSRIFNILEESRDAQEMLENGEETNKIAIVSAKFDDEAWSLSCYNSQIATVISLVTSHGAIIVKIPAWKLASSTNSHAVLKPSEYERLIFDPLFGSNGLLLRHLRQWQKDSGGWWPDALRLVVSTPRTSHVPTIPRMAGAVNQLRDDLRALWSFQVNPATGNPQEPKVKIENILDAQRMEQPMFLSKINVEPGWEKHTNGVDAYGHAITWKKSTGQYQIWDGHSSKTKPFAPPQDVDDDDRLVESENGRGWYPITVTPLGDEVPGMGCRYKDMAEC